MGVTYVTSAESVQVQVNPAPEVSMLAIFPLPPTMIAPESPGFEKGLDLELRLDLELYGKTAISLESVPGWPSKTNLSLLYEEILFTTSRSRTL